MGAPFCLSHNKKKKKERKRDFLSSFLVHSSTFSNTHTHTKTFIFFSESCLMYNATSEILCVLPSKKNERKPSSLSREDCWPSLLPANVGWVCYLFFFPPMQLPSALLCVYPISWKRERRKKKDFGTPPKVLIPFCSIGYLKFDFWLLLLLL